MSKDKPVPGIPNPRGSVVSCTAAVALIMLTLAVYLPARSGGFIWDDADHVTRNQTLLTTDGLWRIWSDPTATPQYYPLVHTTFWIEQHIWGLNPAGYHWTNVLLHALNSLLVWRVLRILSVPGAWLAAAAFALHPVHVESVAWITERKNVLSGAFYLSALLAYLRFAGIGENRDDDLGEWRHYAMALLLFVCALLSKTVVCTLPAVIVLLLWWKYGRVKWTDLWPLIPLFMLGISLGLTTAWLEKNHVGATGVDWQLSWVQRCLIAGRALWFYAGKLVWPDTLIFIYPRWEVDAAIAWQYLFPASALLTVIILWLLRRHIGHGPLVAVLCFAGTLFPALGFIDVYPMRYSFVADHFQYLASVAVLAILAATLTWLMEIWKVQHVWQSAALIAPLLMMLGTQSWRQANVYHNVETLWKDTISKNPSCWMAHANLGLTYLESNRLDEAILHSEKSLTIRPSNVQARTNVGDAFLRKGQVERAIAEYETAMKIDPNYGEALNNLGNALLQVGRVDEAITQCRKVVELRPNFADAHNTLALALLRKGGLDEAIAHCKTAIELQPDFAEAYSNLGNVFLTAGRVDEAVEQYQQAIAIRPTYSEAYHNLGNALLQSGRTDEAIAQYGKALEISPNLPETHNNLGSAWLQKGRMDEAIAQYQKAVEIRPGFVDALINLSNAFSRLGKFTEASERFEKVTLLRPDSAAAHSSLALALLRGGDVAKAITSFERALKIDPEDINALITLSWIFAACPEPSLRNGLRAIEMAKRANEMSKGGNPLALRSLAAAYAETERFQEALQASQQARAIAITQGSTTLAEVLNEEHKLYHAGSPARDSLMNKARSN